MGWEEECRERGEGNKEREKRREEKGEGRREREGIGKRKRRGKRGDIKGKKLLGIEYIYIL